MKESKESIILKQVRDLLDQLEQNASSKVTPQLQETISAKLLQLSCDRYWVYDPLINTIVIHLAHKDSGKEIKLVRALNTLLSNVDLDGRSNVTKIFDRLLSNSSEKEDFSYVEKVNGNFVMYDVTACRHMVGNNVRIIGVTHIADTKTKSMDALILAQQKFKLLMGLSSTFVWEYDAINKVFSANQSLCNKLGIKGRLYSVEELSQYIEVLEIPMFLEKLQTKTFNDKALVHVTCLQSQHTYIFETDFKSVCDKQGNYSLLLGTMNDITEHEMLRAMASKDSLTGCFNRNMADVTLETSFQSFKEKEETYTIIFFDIDKFKNVNDRYGHDMGDYVLTSVCERIGKEIRSNDMMFRWGGDEFLLLCRGIAKENIYGYIDRLRKNIEASTFEFKGTKLQLTISIGAATFYKTDSDFNYAMKRADRSLYKAKLAGRNKVCILN